MEVNVEILEGHREQVATVQAAKKIGAWTKWPMISDTAQVG